MSAATAAPFANEVQQATEARDGLLHALYAVEAAAIYPGDRGVRAHAREIITRAVNATEALLINLGGRQDPEDDEGAPSAVEATEYARLEREELAELRMAVRLASTALDRAASVAAYQAQCEVTR